MSEYLFIYENTFFGTCISSGLFGKTYLQVAISLNLLIEKLLLGFICQWENDCYLFMFLVVSVI